MITNHILLALAWSLYCLLHSVLASKGIKNYLKQKLGRKVSYYRIFYNLLSTVLLILILAWQIKTPTKRIWTPFFMQYPFAIFMIIAGFSGMVFCLRKYFITSAGFRDLFYEGGRPVLVIDGIHKHVRHPLYLTTFIFVWGILLVYPVWSMLIFNIIITVYTLIGIQLEEKKLLNVFGEQYNEYRKRVPMIWPRLRS